MIYGWSPTIGDPGPLGWATVAAYLLAVVLSFAARSGATPLPLTRVIWTGMTVGLVGLAMNKQLDLQSAGTAIMRHLAQTEGWYDQRRGLQETFIVVAVAAAGLAAVALGFIAQRLDRWTNLALAGLLTLMTFVVVRAASFHHVDALIGAAYAGVRLNHILELGGIGLIVVAAAGKIGSVSSARAKQGSPL